MKLKNLKGMIARLDTLRRITIPDDRRKLIHANRYGIIAREARILHARELSRLSAERRRATLVAFVIERQAALTDLAVETFGKLIGSARRKAESSRKERQLQQVPVLTKIAQSHHRLGLALLKAHLWTLPGTQGKSSNSSAAIVVRCSHLSGLSMRSNRPRARMGFADRSQNTGARSKRSTFTGLSDPVRLTNSPYYPLTFFTSSKRLSAMPLPPKLCNCCLSSSSPRRCAPSC